MAMLLLETLLATWNTPDKANRQNFRLADNISALLRFSPHLQSIHLTSLLGWPTNFGAALGKQSGSSPEI